MRKEQQKGNNKIVLYNASGVDIVKIRKQRRREEEKVPSRTIQQRITNLQKTHPNSTTLPKQTE